MPDTSARLPYRVLIDRENDTRWELVAENGALLVERLGPGGPKRVSLETFEHSADGARLANSLTVALARMPPA